MLFGTHEVEVGDMVRHHRFPGDSGFPALVVKATPGNIEVLVFSDAGIFPVESVRHVEDEVWQSQQFTENNAFNPETGSGGCFSTSSRNDLVRELLGRVTAIEDLLSGLSHEAEPRKSKGRVAVTT